MYGRDFACVVKDLADENFTGKKRIVVVVNNLNTHKLLTLYNVFEPKKAACLAHKFEVPHTPKHRSWLNRAEIESNVLTHKCLRRCIPDRETMDREVAAWGKYRNAMHKTANRQFRIKDARIKLKSLYPSVQ